MQTPLRVRAFTPEENRVITKLARSQTASVRLVERATILHLAAEGQTVPQIAEAMGLNEKTVRKWLKRFEQDGLAGLEDAPRSGAPSRYTAENKARVLQAARTRPSELGLPYGSWTFERLAVYVREQLGLPMKKTRIFEILQEEGLRWHKQETWFGERLDPQFVEKRGPSRPSGKTLQPTASS
jgi:transposase